MKTVQLGQVAEVRQGFHFREKVLDDPAGEIRVVQMADIIQDTRFDQMALARIRQEKISAGHLLNSEDILFCARGNRNYHLVLGSLVNKTVASSQFLVITPKKAKILSGYLAWYMNQPAAVGHVNSRRLTGTVPLVNKNALVEMEIPLPSLERQSNLAEICRLLQRETELCEEIQIKRKKMVNQVIITSLEKE